MEWMLQVADEIDDAVGALRLCLLGLQSEIGLLAAGGLAASGICAAVAAGAEMQLIIIATILLGLAVHRRQIH